MPGKLGKCPTCKKEVSTMASFCPHCGERDFFESCEKKVEFIQCDYCRGTKKCESALHPKGGPCGACNGKGRRKREATCIDRRTGEHRFDPPSKIDDPSTEDASGCASIILLALTLASTLLIAVLL